MPATLPELETERRKILLQFTGLGDLRKGSIGAVTRRCGKPTCHCARNDGPGHDPQVRLTTKVGGKTVAESFPSPAAWRKAQSEIDEYHRFQELNLELITVNDEICRQRQVEDEGSTWDSGGKKTAAAVHQEIVREIDQWLHVLFAGRRKTGSLDLEAAEMMVRSAMHRAAATGLTELLRFPVPVAGLQTVPIHSTVAVPGATAQSMGLPDSPTRGGARAMNAGTSTAHIMTPGS